MLVLVDPRCGESSLFAPGVFVRQKTRESNEAPAPLKGDKDSIMNSDAVQGASERSHRPPELKLGRYQG